jgi:glycosyltransferase involved in cell wall biosynthesis
MLDRALRSVWGQTLLPAAVHVAVDTEHQGAAPTRQRALMAATTDWVAFLDSDDLFLPQHLAKLWRHAQETGADYVYSWFKILTADNTIMENDPVFPPGHYLNPFDPEHPIETTITTLVRRELAQAVGFFEATQPGGTNPGHNSGEDRRFTLECIAQGAKISHLVDKTWLWGHHGKNTSGLPFKGDGGLVGSAVKGLG